MNPAKYLCETNTLAMLQYVCLDTEYTQEQNFAKDTWGFGIGSAILFADNAHVWSIVSLHIGWVDKQ